MIVIRILGITLLGTITHKIIIEAEEINVTIEEVGGNSPEEMVEKGVTSIEGPMIIFEAMPEVIPEAV